MIGSPYLRSRDACPRCFVDYDHDEAQHPYYGDGGPCAMCGEGRERHSSEAAPGQTPPPRCEDCPYAD